MTQPRLPCYKLGLKFGREDMVKRFLASRRTSFYFRVVQEGEVGPKDAIEMVSRDKDGITVVDITRLYLRENVETKMLRRASELEALPQNWRDHFRKQLDGR